MAGYNNGMQIGEIPLVRQPANNLIHEVERCELGMPDFRSARSPRVRPLVLAEPVRLIGGHAIRAMTRFIAGSGAVGRESWRDNDGVTECSVQKSRRERCSKVVV